MSNKSKKLVLKKLCRGLYMDHNAGSVLTHEMVWEKSEGRKWIAEWTIYPFVNEPFKRSRKFNTKAEALDFLRKIHSGEIARTSY